MRPPELEVAHSYVHHRPSSASTLRWSGDGVGSQLTKHLQGEVGPLPIARDAVAHLEKGPVLVARSTRPSLRSPLVGRRLQLGLRHRLAPQPRGLQPLAAAGNAPLAGLLPGLGRGGHIHRQRDRRVFHVRILSSVIFAAPQLLHNPKAPRQVLSQHAYPPCAVPDEPTRRQLFVTICWPAHDLAQQLARIAWLARNVSALKLVVPQPER